MSDESTNENNTLTNYPSLQDNTLDFGTICIIDDDPHNIKLLEKILARNFYTIVSATDGDGAFEVINNHKPDLILLDIMFTPELNGYDICKRLKEDEETQDIPVIFISALDQTIDKVKAFDVGGVDYMTKPFALEEVIARVQTHLLQYQIKKQHEIQYRALQEEIKKRKTIEKQLEETNRQLEQIVTIDPLSGLINRKHFLTHYEQEWRRMVREKKHLSVILCDIDDFESFNQQFGTQNGDLVLQKMASIVRKSVRRPGDIVARWGEDEFILLLPSTNLNGAKTLSDNILKKELNFSFQDDKDETHFTISLSIGMSTLVPTIGIDLETLLAQASEALSLAKEGESAVMAFNDIEVKE